MNYTFREFKTWTGLAALGLLLSFARPSRADSLYLWEGFEHELNWTVNEDSAATGRVLDSTQASEGAHSLKVLFKTMGASGRAAVSRWESFDWSSYGRLKFDVYNPGGLADLRPTLVLYTGSRWVQFEQELPALAPGWNHVDVDLTAKAFVSSDSSFHRAGYLLNRSEVQGISFAFSPHQVAEGWVAVDNVRLERSGILRLGDFTLNTALEGVGSTGNLDYLPPGMRLRSEDFRGLEGFEDETAALPWSPSNSNVRQTFSRDYQSQGNQSLAVDFPEARGGFDLAFTDATRAHLAGARQFRVEVYNPGAPISLAMVMVDAQGNYYSNFRGLVHGWNTLIFDFTNPRSWNGPALTAEAMADIATSPSSSGVYVALSLYPVFPGRLYFDGLATSTILVRGAATTRARFNLVYAPTADFEATVETTVDDTFYGAGFKDARDGGVEASISAAGLRYDAAGFRTRAAFNHPITAFDHPIMKLLLSSKLGSKIAAGESSGRFGELEVQGVAASRLEFERFNSWVPTGLGPENVLALRARTPLGPGRVGSTFLSHQATWGRGVTGLPSSRQTFGLDYDSHLEFDGFSLGAAAEGAATTGDRFQDQAIALSPDNDIWYYGARITPEWKRLKFNYTYTMLGYDFDATFTEWGPEEDHAAILGINLEGLGPFAALKELPLYDRSLGNNLRLEVSWYGWTSRTRYRDTEDGNLKPSFHYDVYEAKFENDLKSKPYCKLETTFVEWADQWYQGHHGGLAASTRLPMWDIVNLTAGGSYVERLTVSKALPSLGLDSQSGLQEDQSANLGLEASRGAYAASLSGNWVGTVKSWQGEWGAWDQHWKWRAMLQRAVGSDSLLQLDYGMPALLLSDFGLQDTLNVWTLTYKTFF